MTDAGARLTILNGPLAGKDLALGETVDNILIGSDSSCRFHIASPGISPIHARIWMDAGGVTVYDTHSPRGLYINDDRVNGQAPLKNGDILWLGTPGEEEAVMIQVRLPVHGEAAAPEPRLSTDEPDVVVDTVMMAAPLAARPDPEPAIEPTQAMEAVPEPAAFEVSAPDDNEATMLEMPADVVVPTPAEDESDATVVDFSPRISQDEFAVSAPDDNDATMVVPSEPRAPEVAEPDEHGTIAMSAPMKFAVELPPTPPPSPPAFEDETAEEPEPPQAAPAWAPPPPPPTPPPPPPAPTPPPRAPVAAPAPRPAPRAPSRRETPSPRPAPARASSGGSRNLMFVGAGLLVLALGAFATWKLLQGAKHAETAVAPPVTSGAAPPTTLAVAAPQALGPVAAPEPVPEPPIEEAVTIVKSTPPPTLAAAGATPRPSATPAPGKGSTPPPPTTMAPELLQAQQSAQQVATLLGRGDAAAASRDFAGAAAAYDEVLKLEPGHARATEGRAQAQAAVASLKKTFVAGRTTVTGGKAAKGGLSGFDSEDVSVAQALDYSGRIDFETSPRNVRSGDSYTVQVYLTNDGKKGFKIGNVTVTTAVNGSRSGGPAAVRAKDVEPGQRVMLTEVPGTWQASTTSWSMEVVVTSSRNDTFRSQLSWR